MKQSSPAIDLLHAHWDLSRMQVAPENPRYGRPVRDLDSLAATIKARGLLQPLIGYWSENDLDQIVPVRTFHVVAGARRLAALQLLKEQGELPEALSSVPVRICDKSDARDAGLIEQTQRVNLHPAEEASAYAACIDDGQEPADVAKAYGQTERFVKQRLKLSTLHPPIFAAFQASEITIDVAAAFAAGSLPRQEAAWDTFGKDATAHQVRNHYKSGALPSTDKVALFVGEELYTKQGGAIDRDLFSEGHDFWLDPSIANNAAKAKLEARCAALKAEGWSFAHCSIDGDRTAYAWERSQPKRQKPSADQKKRLDEIEARVRVLDDLEEASDGWGLNDQQSAEYQALDAEQQAIDGALNVWSDHQKAKSGVHVCIGEGGDFEIEYGFFLKEDRQPAVAAARHDYDDESTPHAGAFMPPPEEAADTSIVAHQILTNAAGAMVGRALQANPFVAIVALTAHLARKQFGWGVRDNSKAFWAEDSTQSPIRLSETHAPHYSRPDPMDGDDQEAADNAWIEKLKPCKGELEDFLHSQGEAFTYELLAHLSRPYIRATEDHPKRPSLATRRRIAALGRLAKADPEWFKPSVELLKGFTRGALDDAAKEMGLDAPAAMKKGALAQLVADKAAELKWQPPLLREMIGAPKFKLPKAMHGKKIKVDADAKPKAAKKPAKPTKPKAALKPGAAGRSGRVFKAAVKIESASIEIDGAAKPKRGRPSNAEKAARAAALAEAAE